MTEWTAGIAGCLFLHFVLIKALTIYGGKRMFQRLKQGGLYSQLWAKQTMKNPEVDS